MSSYARRPRQCASVRPVGYRVNLIPVTSHTRPTVAPPGRYRQCHIWGWQAELGLAEPINELDILLATGAEGPDSCSISPSCSDFFDPRDFENMSGRKN